MTISGNGSRDSIVQCLTDRYRWSLVMQQLDMNILSIRYLKLLMIHSIFDLTSVLLLYTPSSPRLWLLPIQIFIIKWSECTPYYFYNLVERAIQIFCEVHVTHSMGFCEVFCISMFVSALFSFGPCILRA